MVLRRRSRPARRPRRRVARKGLRRRAPRRMGRAMNGNRDFATVTEVTEREVGANEGSFITHCLADFARARTVAAQYRMYRCKKVEVEFVPYANIATQGQSFPELFTQVDRTCGLVNGAAYPLPTKASMEAKGCLPQKLTSIIKKFYKPSVLRNENLWIQAQSTQQTDGPPPTFSSTQRNLKAIAGITSTPVFNKWYMVQHYNTTVASNQPSAQYPFQADPSIDSFSLQYYGMSYFIDQPSQPQSVVGKLVIKVHWQFKQPLWPYDLGIPLGYQTGGEGWEDNGNPSSLSTVALTAPVLNKVMNTISSYTQTGLEQT